MQNEILSQLASRKSVRVFTDREIGEEARLAILTAASDAPTAGNQQLYTVIDVRDQEKKDRLAKSCDDQPFIAEAKLVLVFCADLLKWHAAFRAAGADPRPAGVGDLLLATCDAMAAAQNAVTAAWSLGIGSCYIGDILENRAVQKEILSLPDRVVPVAMLVFGYPAQQQLDRKKPARTDLRHLVHEDQYHTLSDEEALDLTRYHFGAGDIREHLKAFCERKYNSGFAREMTRSVAEYLTEFDRETAPVQPVQPAAEPASQPGLGMAIAGMVCGILSFFFFGFILGLLGLIFGCVARSKGYQGGMATAGIVCGVIALALWLILIIAGFSFDPYAYY